MNSKLNDAYLWNLNPQKQFQKNAFMISNNTYQFIENQEISVKKL